MTVILNSNVPSINGEVQVIPSTTSFYRQRFVEPKVEFAFKHTNGEPLVPTTIENFPLFWSNVEHSGAGTGTLFDIDRSSVSISVSNLTAGERKRHTNRKFYHQPGTGGFYAISFLLGLTGSGIKKRIGLFNSTDEIFFQNNEGNYQFGYVSSTTGAPIETIIDRANWNQDKLDGTGLSGLSVDLDNIQQFFVDFVWHNRIIFGFTVGDRVVFCHTEQLSNLIGPIISQPNMSIGIEIENDGTGIADQAEIFDCIHFIDAGQGPPEFRRSNNLGATPIAIATSGTNVGIIGIRLRSGFSAEQVAGALITIVEISGSSKPFNWSLRANPTFNIPLTWGDEIFDKVQFGTGVAGSTLLTPGIIIESGNVAGQLQTQSQQLANFLRLTGDLMSTADEIVVVVESLQNNESFLGSFAWDSWW